MFELPSNYFKFRSTSPVCKFFDTKFLTKFVLFEKEFPLTSNLIDDQRVECFKIFSFPLVMEEVSIRRNCNFYTVWSYWMLRIMPAKRIATLLERENKREYLYQAKSCNISFRAFLCRGNTALFEAVCRSLSLACVILFYLLRAVALRNTENCRNTLISIFHNSGPVFS